MWVLTSESRHGGNKVSSPRSPVDDERMKLLGNFLCLGQSFFVFFTVG